MSNAGLANQARKSYLAPACVSSTVHHCPPSISRHSCHCLCFKNMALKSALLLGFPAPASLFSLSFFRLDPSPLSVPFDSPTELIPPSPLAPPLNPRPPLL